MKCFCLLNHNLTQQQIDDLKSNWGVDMIIYPEPTLKETWSNIPTTPTLDWKPIKAIYNWWKENKAEPNDLFVVQGEMGSTYAIIDYAKKFGLVPLHAVSKRVSVEKVVDNTTVKESIFEHVCFRKYETFALM